MKSIPKWGSPKGYLMSQTASRKVRGRIGKKENIPVRNLVKEIASVAALSPSYSKENAKKRVSFEPPDSPSESNLKLTETQSPSDEHSVLSESRYNLRSFTQNKANEAKSQLQSIINKAFVTPSRAKSNISNAVNKSIYRTPKIQSNINNRPLKDDKRISKEQKGIWKEEITDLLNKTWKTSYLSTSVDFKYETKNLKKSYEAVLRNRILDTYPAYEVTVQIVTTSMLNRNPKENDGVLFIVTTVEPEKEDDRDEPKEPLIYKAFLIKSTKVQSEQLPNSEWFPLLLYRGAERIHHTFITWLQSSFGCYVTPKHLPQSCMLWLAALWSRVKCEQKYHGINNIGSSIHFHYIIRPPCTEKKFKHSEENKHIFLKVECQSSDIRNIWTRLTDSDKGSVNSEDIIEFHSLMGSFMESLCSLPKSLLQLYLLKTPCMTISGDGRLRLTCSGKFPSVLRHLIEIFHETCHFNSVDFVNVLPEEMIADIENEMGG